MKSRTFGDASQNPAGGEANSKRVDAHVHPGSTAPRHKGLMPLVAGGEQDGRAHAAHQRARSQPSEGAERAKKQQAQHGIFADMIALDDEDAKRHPGVAPLLPRGPVRQKTANGLNEGRPQNDGTRRGKNLHRPHKGPPRTPTHEKKEKGAPTNRGAPFSLSLDGRSVQGRTRLVEREVGA